MSDIELIKKRLNEEIEQSGVKKIHLSKMLGLSNSLISEYKTKKKMPSLETFAKICKVLNLDANYVLGIRDFEDE